ncbi:MAG: hypothetical protein LBR50_02500 [Tannerella sp.]|nr:hypothetical protein [Tannerella sp.]
MRKKVLICLLLVFAAGCSEEEVTYSTEKRCWICEMTVREGDSSHFEVVRVCDQTEQEIRTAERTGVIYLVDGRVYTARAPMKCQPEPEY